MNGINIRPQWCFEAAHVCQHIVGACLRPYEVAEEELVKRLTTTVPPSVGPLERALQLGMMWRALTASLVVMHRLYHSLDTKPCQWSPPPPPSTDLLDFDAAMTHWLCHALARFRQQHPKPLPFRIVGTALHLDASVLTAGRLARELSTSPAHVNAAIRCCCRRTLAQFRAELQVKRAIGLLLTTDIKVEAVALSVGFRSKRSLYNAIRRACGVTPGTLRRQGTTAKGAGALIASDAARPADYR